MASDKLTVVYDSRLRAEPVRYALSSLLSAAGVPHRLVPMEAAGTLGSNDLILSYGPVKPQNLKTRIHVYAARLFEPDCYLTTGSLPTTAAVSDGVPILYCGTHHEYTTWEVKKDKNTASLSSNMDVFASAFVLLTHYEELVKGGPLDGIGRFSSSGSFLKEHDLLHRPLVNEYAELVKNWIRQIAPDFAFVQRSYQGRDFAIALTHDLDSLHKHPYLPRRRIAEAVLDRKFRTATKLFSEAAKICWLGSNDPYNNLSDVIEWESRMGIRSSIYLMGSNGLNDSNYELAELGRAPLLESIRDDGWEIGFHSGYGTYLDAEAFNRQLESVQTFLNGLPGKGKPIEGGRQHYLNFRVPYTWRIWEQAGLGYDSTLGFADHEGFRSGICLPFRPFDLLENRQMNLLELPLTVMDTTLDKYRHLSPEQSEVVLTELLKAVRRHHGVLVLLWHNTYFGTQNGGEYHHVLAKFLRKALADGGYVGSAGQILSSQTKDAARYEMLEACA